MRSPDADGDAAANWRLVCLLTLAAFAGLAVAAALAGPLPGDLGLRHELLADQSARVVQLARIVNEAGTWRVLLPASILLFLFFREARRHWWLWCALLVGSSLIEQAVKFLVERPRPSGFSSGFPSGHTTAAATFGVVVIYIASRVPLPPGGRWALQAVAVALVVLVGWARVVLHAHWPTDVLGGLLLGAGCAAAGAWWEQTRGDAPALR